MNGTRPAIIANKIRLLRAHHQGTFLIVEGRDDRLLSERVIDGDACRVVVAEGKESVLATLAILEQDNFRGVAGMVDADHDRLRGVEAPSRNVLVPDTHDLESMLIRSTALEAVLIEFGSADKINAWGREVREILFEAATGLGALRLSSTLEGLGLTFSGLNYSSFLDPDTVAPRPGAMFTEIRNRSMRHDIQLADLERRIAAIGEQAHDPWQLCCGDDLLGALTVGLRKALGNHSSTSATPEVLRRALRLAFDREEFSRSALYDLIKTWEEHNPPFRILRR